MFQSILCNKVIRQSLRITLFFILVSLVGFTAKGQKYYFDYYSVVEGLAQSKVHFVMQDEKGYLWLGTESGASRFDGHQFINYSAEDGLAESGIKIIYADKQKNLWFGHKGGGITFYDGNSFMVHPLSEKITGDITSIIEDDRGELIITTHGDGLFIIRNPEEKDTSLLDYEQFKGQRLSDRIFGSMKTLNDSIYLITDVGIKIYRPDSGTFGNYLPDGLTTYWQITDMYQDSHGNMWVGTYNGGLYELVKETGEFIVYDARDGLAHNFITTIAEDSKGNIWVGTWGGGITRFYEDGFKTYNKGNGLIDEKVYCITEDFEGNILIGTYEHGLAIFKGEKFVTYDVDDGLANNQVYAINRDREGKFWFGTNQGITVMDPFLEKEERAPDYYDLQSNSIGDQIRFIKKDPQDNLWIGTNDNGVQEYSQDQERFIYNPIINAYLRFNLQLTALEADDKNQLWIGTNDGLVYYNILTRESERISQLNGLTGNDINTLFADSQNRIWVGLVDDGLNMIKDSTIIEIPYEGRMTPSCITEDQDGNIWFGTTTKGVFVCNGDSIIRNYNQNDGLLSNLINQVNVDNYNNIYIGTNLGLNKIAPSGNIFTYSEKSGFVGIEAKSNASFKDEQGRMWFGTVKGVTRYDPELADDSTIQPLTHIAGMKVNLEERSMIDGQTFNFTENSIIFYYNSVCLSNPDAVRYQIKLEGADKDWRPVTEQTMVNYSSLAPDNYVFKVKARNSAGEWNEEPVTYSFTINPPFYKTWWFITGMILLGLIGIYLFIKIRERNLIKEKKILEEKVAERTAEVVQKSEEIEQKNKDIMDSIKYAQRIQIAILPPEVPFEDTFVLFRPKDIVSGDFYWFETHGDKEMLAAVDCTGHGVPGAFLSILGHNLLTKIVKEYGILEPAEILNKLNKELVSAMHQQKAAEGHIVNDGMDLALLSYDKKKKEVAFAGAYNPLFLVRNGELIETKADRFAIGRSVMGEAKNFTNHKLSVQKGDSVYVFSDGYADQFGGPKNKKFRVKNMKRLLESLDSTPIQKRKEKLEQTIVEWMDGNEQIDDIVIIGRQF